MSDKHGRRTSRRSFLLGSTGIALATFSAGCGSSAASDCQDQHTVEYDGPVASVTGYRAPSGVRSIIVKTQPLAQTATVDLFFDEGTHRSQKVPPSSEAVKSTFNLTCYRESFMDGCKGAPYGEYSIQLRRSDTVIERHSVAVNEPVDDCFQVTKVEND